MSSSAIFSLLGISLMLVIGIAADKASNNNQRFPRIILLLFGGYLLTQSFDLFQLHSLATLNNLEFIEFIAELVLSLVLFREGLELNLKSFLRSIKSVLVLAFFGVILTSVFFAGLISLFTPVNFLLGLLIAGILAPTDPAATFSLFKGSLKINPNEQTILGNESALNDAVAIVLVTTVFITSVANEKWTFSAKVIIDISTSFFGGIVLGVILGYIFLRINRKLDNYEQTNFISLSLVFLTFVLAVLLHGYIEISAAITALTAGAVFANPALFKIDPFSRHHLHEFQNSVSGLGELIAFVALGMAISNSYLLLSALLGFAFALLILASRFFTIVGILRFPAKLNYNESVFIAWGGMKGLATGVLALISYISLRKSFDGGISSNVFLNSILFALIIGSIIQGFTIKYVGKKTGSIRIADKRSEYRAQRRIIISQLAYYREKLEAGEISNMRYDAKTIELKDKLRELNNKIEQEKIRELEKIERYIDEFAMVEHVLHDAYQYRELLKANNRPLFYVNEQISEYLNKKEEIITNLLTRLEIAEIKLKSSHELQMKEAEDILRFAQDKLYKVKTKFADSEASALYSKICDILHVEVPNTSEVEFIVADQP